jgi:hypothetical protein
MEQGGSTGGVGVELPTSNERSRCDVTVESHAPGKVWACDAWTQSASQLIAEKGRLVSSSCKECKEGSRDRNVKTTGRKEYRPSLITAFGALILFDAEQVKGEPNETAKGKA